VSLVVDLAPAHGVSEPCRALGLPRASYYRKRAPQLGPRPRRPAPPRRLPDAERQQILDVLHEDRFADLAPPEVHATLLEEGSYLCSVRTIYRVLAENTEVRERRNQLRHPHYAPPQLLATGPNQVWSWDITKLLGPAKWTYFYLYVILDIFSRYVVGWLLADAEETRLAKTLIAESCLKQNIVPGQLVIHRPGEIGQFPRSRRARHPGTRGHRNGQAELHLPLIRGVLCTPQTPRNGRGRKPKGLSYFPVALR
jgi:putative transposase